MNGSVPVMGYEHCLDELKGWPDESALDFDAFLSANVTVDPVYGGCCVHVNQQGEFELGIGNTDMGIFLLAGSHELDVANPGGNNWTPIAPTGKMSGLVATGAYELETTEFYQTGTGTPQYPPGTLLTSPTEAMVTTGTDKSAAGQLFSSRSWPGGSAAAIAPATDAICAVTSRMNHINHNRVWVVSFWPVYCPMG
jgi:hypothetical protein